MGSATGQGTKLATKLATKLKSIKMFLTRPATEFVGIEKLLPS